MSGHIIIQVVFTFLVEFFLGNKPFIKHLLIPLDFLGYEIGIILQSGLDACGCGIFNDVALVRYRSITIRLLSIIRQSNKKNK